MKTIAFNQKCIIAFLILLTPFICFASSQGKIEVKGVRIVSDGYGTDIDGLKPFNQFKGTSIACLVTLPNGGIIKFDEDNSRVDEFIDNLGTNLLNDQIPIGSGIGMMHQVSSDRKAVMFEINGLNLPNKQAASIKTNGYVSLKTANSKKKYKVDGVALKVGTKLDVAGIHLEVSKLGKPMWGDGVVSIEFSSKKDMSKIAGIKFYDTKGVLIKSSSGGSGIQTMDKVKTYERSYTLYKRPDFLNLSIICWDDMKTVKVPFDINTSVGL